MQCMDFGWSIPHLLREKKITVGLHDFLKLNEILDKGFTFESTKTRASVLDKIMVFHTLAYDY